MLYSKHNKGEKLIISSIRHDWDVFFIEFENGDIFHLYYMMDDEEPPQRLGIYRPGNRGHDWAKNRYAEFEEPEFEQDNSVNINDWFNRYSENNE